MPSAISQQWQEKASGFFSSSGVKLNEAGQTAGTFVEEVAKDAKVKGADVAERVGSMVKNRWAILQQPATRHAVQEGIITVAATTGTFLRRSISGTKDKVAVGKTNVEEVSGKQDYSEEQTILTDIERWQKGVASTDGLNAHCFFKADGDKKVIQQLVSMYNQDPNASLPDGLNPIDVAALTKYYLASLPEPLTTFEPYSEMKGACSSVHAMRNVLKRLPTVNYMALEFITALLPCVSRKSVLNKMGARNLAMEMAPIIMWQKGGKVQSYRQYWSHLPKTDSKKLDQTAAYNTWDMLADEGEDIDVPLDDGMPINFGAIEVIQCLIEQHNPLFTDAKETAWR